MTTLSSFPSTTVNHLSSGNRCAVFRRRYHYCKKANTVRCNNKGKEPRNESASGGMHENVMLKVAWYGSELLGVVASLLRSPAANRETEAAEGNMEPVCDESGAVERSVVVAAIKDDFLRSYFVTGKVTMGVYEEDCEFADPAGGSFKGLRRFKRNCTNFGYLVHKSHLKLVKWEDFEEKAIGHWRFSCVLAFPWKPTLSASGYTEYYLSVETGKVWRHVEHWNVPKLALFKQLLTLRAS